MAQYFLDTSAYVKRLVTETGTDFIRGLFTSDEGPDLFMSRLAAVEAVAAVSRRHKAGDISDTDVGAIFRTVEQDFRSEVMVIEMTLNVATTAMRLAQKYALRASDAVQLASAVETQQIRGQLSLLPLTFVSSDAALNLAARGEGFEVLNAESGH